MFEEKCFEYLKKRYNKVIWKSKEDWHSPHDFECFEGNKKMLIEAKKNKKGIYSGLKKKKGIDYFIIEDNGELKIISTENIKDSIKNKKNTYKEIFEFLKSQKDKPTTTKEIIESLNSSYPTITKWLEVLKAEGKILVNDYGNIKFYYPNNEK